MHIGFVVSGFSPYSRGGGIVAYVAEVADALRLSGHAVTIFSTVLESSTPRSYIHDYLPVITIPVMVPGRLLPGRVIVENARRVARAVHGYQDAGNRIDILEVPDIGALGLFINLTGTKMVARLHTGTLELAKGRGRGWDPRVLMVHRLERQALRRAHLVTPLTNYQMEVAKRLYGIDESRVSIVPNFVRLQPSSANNGNGKTIGLFGTVERRKGVPVLCEAFNIIGDRHPEARLVVAGRDTLERHPYARQSTIEFCKGHLREPEKVRFTGLLSREKALQEMQQCAVVVLPSLYEAFPMVLLEAMQQGKAVVASAVCGIPEIVEEGRTGFLVRPKDPMGLASAISTLLEDPEMAKRMGLQGRKIVEQRFSEAVVIPQLIGIYDSL